MTDTVQITENREPIDLNTALIELRTARAEIERLRPFVDMADGKQRAEDERDGAYRERAHLVAWLAALHPAVIAPAPDIDEPGWQIVYVYAGGWQMSWHISPRDAELFKGVKHVAAEHPRAQWDGHQTDQKYARIRKHTRVIHLNERLGNAVDHAIPPAIDRAIRRDHSLCGVEPCSDCR